MNKLRSSSGATLVLTLVFFLICVMVSTVIITAASVNVSRTETQTAEQKVYLSVSSAARLIRDQFSSACFYLQKQQRDHTCPYAGTGEHASTITAWDTPQTFDSDSTLISYTGLFADDYLTDVKSLLNAPSIALGAHTYQFTGDGMDAVSVVMQVQTDFSVTFTVSSGVTTMTVSFLNPDIKKTTATDSSSETCSYTSSETVVNEADNSFEEIEVTNYRPILITTTTETIQLTTAGIEKGADT